MERATIERFHDRWRDDVLDMLTQAYLDDPWGRIWFGGSGPGQLKLHRSWWSFMLEQRCAGIALVSIFQEEVVGFAHWQESDLCRPSTEAGKAMGAAMLGAIGAAAAQRMRPFLIAFRAHEPTAAHLHFGPFAVRPDLQGRGFGRSLLERYCEHLTASGSVGYLETSEPDNVRIYSKAGFEVTSESDIGDAHAWFMTRAAPPGGSRTAAGGQLRRAIPAAGSNSE